MTNAKDSKKLNLRFLFNTFSYFSVLEFKLTLDIKIRIYLQFRSDKYKQYYANLICPSTYE